MELDYDQKFGLWLQDVPYWWSPGEEPNTGKRFYVSHPNSIAVFDNELLIDTIYNITSEMLHGRILPSETFCVLPLEQSIHRDMNLVYVYPNSVIADGTVKPFDVPYKLLELRLNGQKIEVKKGPPLTHNITFEYPGISNKTYWVNINTSNDSDNVQGEFLYSWRMGSSASNAGKGIRCDLTFKSQNSKRTKRYYNLYDVVMKEKYTYQDILMIHHYALEGSNGWAYDWKFREGLSVHGSLGTCVIMYEILMGARNMYVLRTANNDPQPYLYIEKLQKILVSREPKVTINDLYNNIAINGLMEYTDNTEFKLAVLELKLKELLI